MTPEMREKITILRQKALEGPLSLEDMKEAIILLRSDRQSASMAASEAAKRGRAKQTVKSADDMLKELGGF